LGLCFTTSGLLKRSQGEFKDAVDTLQKAIAFLKEADARRELALAYLHLAGVHFSLKRKSLALESLQLAANAVSELGYDHFLLVEAARNTLLIQYAAANKLADGYYARVLKLIKTPQAVSRTELSAESTEQETTDGIRAYGFGQPRAVVGGHEVQDLEWRSEKSKEMFFFFLCNRRPLRKEEIVTALWPDLSGDKTSSAFHSTLYRLRQALYPECIAKESGRYILDPQGRFVFDLDKFQKALSRAEASPAGSPEAIAFMEKALAQHKGPFAQDFYGEWVETLRWQTEEQSMRLLSTLAAAYSDAGEFKRSADLCQRILEVDEYNEAAWYRLMSNYLRSGQIDAAKYCYNRYAQIVSDNLSGEELTQALLANESLHVLGQDRHVCHPSFPVRGTRPEAARYATRIRSMLRVCSRQCSMHLRSIFRAVQRSPGRWVHQIGTVTRPRRSGVRLCAHRRNAGHTIRTRSI